MDQLKQVRDNVNEYIYAGKQMTLAERIRYDNYLQNFYELSIKEYNNQKFSCDDFSKLFNRMALYHILPSGNPCTILQAYDHLTSTESQWVFLKRCLQDCRLYSAEHCYKADIDEQDILLFIYGEFDAVLKTLK